ncbi:FAD-dependent oxidoreductase [Nocardia crassostreae]|uniref:FAD-dependent oxidoreductase n=1 Tax=Nocardia crassostreae TaxID=53428 RepID=UPI0008318DC8|nr:NAD(P)/FAD-dependent oxidoreductase [Nocardia crassostreae]
MTKILIAGAGVGGLALAQALHHGGVDVSVFERDPTPTIRNQGYRIHVDANGNAALRACLPTAALELVRRTSGTNDDVLGGYTHQLEQLMLQHFPGIPEGEITNVDRNTFRQGLLTGLEGIVEFGRTVTGYEVGESGGVRARFADGGENGDVLIGADGVGSAIRGQLLPHATVRDLGVRCVYGRMPITEATAPLIPEVLAHGFNWVADESGLSAAFGPVRFRTPVPGATDFLMATLLVRPTRLGLTDEQLFALTPEQLWKLTISATAAWHPALRDLFAHADPETFFPIPLRAADRVPPWRPGPVTLLGDAVHTMPPTGGSGANTALQDAETLAGELLSAARGEQALIDAVAAYQRVMLPRGFATVDASLRMAAQLFGEDY